MKPSTVLTPDHDALELPNGRKITNCAWRVRTFLERDAYAAYDVAVAYRPGSTDQLEERHRVAMNNAMRARSSVAAWEPFLNKPIPELADVPRELCLIHGPQTEVDLAIELVAEVVARIGAVDRLTDMAATKMLYLLRPRFVAISDSYVRSALGVWDGTPPRAGSTRAAFVRQRFTAVMRAVRALGDANRVTLKRLEAFVAGLGSVTIADDCQDSAHRWRGTRLSTADLSPLRILDILLWTDGATRIDPKWVSWAASRDVSEGA